MANIQPFKGWRYHPDKSDIATVLAPPYDVIDQNQQNELYARNNRNIIRLILGHEYESDNEINNKYTRAAEHLATWRKDNYLYHDKKSIYICEQEFSFGATTHVRRGFFAKVLLEEFGKGSVFPHERTLAGPKIDRLRLMHACRGNLSPVFGLLSDGNENLVNKLKQLADWEPTVTAEDDDGVITRFWVADKQNQLSEFCNLLRKSQIYIADGHHRYETALNYRNEIRQAIIDAGESPPPLGELPADWVMMMCVPIADQGLVIGPTHRLVHDVKNFEPDKLIEGCRELFMVKQVNEPQKILKQLEDLEQPPTFGLCLKDKKYILQLNSPEAMNKRASEMPEAWCRLDASVLHLLLLEDLLNIDEKKLLRKENIIYVRSGKEALLACPNDPAIQAVFLMRATTMEQVKAVSQAGEVMPQKSTYFYPKIPTGLVFNLFW